MRSLRSYFLTSLLRLVFKRHKPSSVPIEKQRADFIKMMARTFKPQPDVSYEVSELGSVAGEWVRHGQDNGQRSLLYLHGGGYMLGCPEAYRDLTGRLAIAAAADLFVADYRLAPEDPFPAALEDALACYRALINDGIPASSITIAGDSAGGGLTLATLVALREAGDPLPAAAVCLSPWSDLNFTGPTMTINSGSDPMLTAGTLGAMADAYAGTIPDGQDRTNPRMSPYYGDLSGLPPILIQVGSDEILLDDARRVAEKITHSGRQVTLNIWPGMPHVWQMFAALIPEGREAITDIGEYVQANTRPAELLPKTVNQ